MLAHHTLSRCALALREDLCNASLCLRFIHTSSAAHATVITPAHQRCVDVESIYVFETHRTAYYQKKSAQKKIQPFRLSNLTMLQIAQMLFGVSVGLVALGTPECADHRTNTLMSLGMYTSYAVLFIRLFQSRRKSNRKVD